MENINRFMKAIGEIPCYEQKCGKWAYQFVEPSIENGKEHLSLPKDFEFSHHSFTQLLLDQVPLFNDDPEGWDESNLGGH